MLYVSLVCFLRYPPVKLVLLPRQPQKTLSRESVTRGSQASADPLSAHGHARWMGQDTSFGAEHTCSKSAIGVRFWIAMPRDRYAHDCLDSSGASVVMGPQRLRRRAFERPGARELHGRRCRLERATRPTMWLGCPGSSSQQSRAASEVPAVATGTGTRSLESTKDARSNAGACRARSSRSSQRRLVACRRQPAGSRTLPIP